MLNVEVDVPEDIPFLEIKAGHYDLQRFVYWGFMKTFWNKNYTFSENNHTNFDWYAPVYAHRYTKKEIYKWCAMLNCQSFILMNRKVVFPFAPKRNNSYLRNRWNN